MTKQMTNRLKFDMIKVLQNGRHGALLLLPTQEVIYMANAGMKPAAPCPTPGWLSRPRAEALSHNRYSGGVRRESARHAAVLFRQAANRSGQAAGLENTLNFSL